MNMSVGKQPQKNSVTLMKEEKKQRRVEEGGKQSIKPPHIKLDQPVLPA
jgi:hypothetical protein